MSNARLWPAPYAENLALQEAADRQRIHARYQAAGTHALAVQLAELSGTYPTLGGGPLLGAALAGVLPDDPRMADLAITSTRLDAEALDGLRATTLESVGNHGGSIWSLPLDLFKSAVRTTFLGFDALWEELLMRPFRTAVGVYQGMSWEDAYGAAGASTGLRAIQTALQDPWGSFTPAPSRADAQVNVGSGFFPGSTLSDETRRLMGQGTDIEAAARNPEQQRLGAPLSQITRQQRETGIQLTSHGGLKSPISPGRLLAIGFSEPGSTLFGIASGLTDLAANIYADPSNLAFNWLSDVQKGMSTILSPSLITGGTRKVLAPRALAGALESRAGVNFVDGLARNDVSFETVLGMLKSSNGFVPPKVAIDVYEAAKTGDPNTIRQAFLQHEPSFVGGQTPWRESILGRRLNTRSGTLLGAPVSTALGRFGAPALVQGGIGAAAGAGIAAVTGQDPTKGAMIGGAAGLGLSLSGVTRLPGGGDLGAFIGRTQTAGLALHYDSRKADTYLGWLATSVGAHGYSVRDKPRSLEDFAENLMLMRLPAGTRDELLVRMAKSEGMPELYGVVRDSYEKWADQLVSEGIERNVANSVVRLYQKEWTDFRAYWVNKAKNAQYVPGGRLELDLNGKPMPIHSASLMSELVDQWVPILDPKVVRAALRRTNRHSIISRDAFTDWDRLGDRAITRAADSFMTKVWKPLVLLRVAWPVRVITEEQIRMAALGLNSTFRHPIQYLATMLAGSDSQRIAERIMAAGRSRARDAQGELMRLSDEFAAVRSRRSDWTGGIDVRDPHTGEFRVAGWGEGDHAPGHVNRVGLLTRDAIAPSVADAARKWRAAGHSLSGEPGFLADVKRRFVEGDLQQHRWQFAHDGGRQSVFYERAAAEDYVDYVWGQIVSLGGIDAYYRRGYGVFPNPKMATVAGTGEQVGLPGPRGTIIDPGGSYVDSMGNDVPIETVNSHRGRPAVSDTGSIGDIDPDVRVALDSMFGAVETGALDRAASELNDLEIMVTRGTAQLGPTATELPRILGEYRAAVNMMRAARGVTPDDLANLRPLTDELVGALIPPRPSIGRADVRPQMEARRLALEDMTPYQLSDVGGRAASDGVYRIPGSPAPAGVTDPLASSSVIVVRDGHVVAQLTYRMGEPGAGRAVGEISVMKTAPAGHPLGRPSDGRDMIDEMLRVEGLDTSQLLNMTLGPDGSALGDWLRLRQLEQSSLIRYDRPGATRGPSEGRGLFTSPVSITGEVTPHAAEGLVPTKFQLSADAKVLEATERRVNHPRFLGRAGVVDANISVLPDDLLGRLLAEDLPDSLRYDPERVRGMIRKDFGIEPAEAFDTLDAIGEYGAHWARAQGYDAIRLVDQITPSLSEVVLLTDSAASRATGLITRSNPIQASSEGLIDAIRKARSSDVTTWGQDMTAMVIPKGSLEPTQELLDLIADDVWRYTDPTGVKVERPGMFRDGADGTRPWLAREKRDHSSRKAEFSRQYTTHLDERMIDPATGRNLFRETKVSAPVHQGPDQIGTWDKAVNYMFDVLMGKRTDTLSRSPAFNQFYWKRMARLIPYLEPEDARKALTQLRAMNMRTFTEWGQDLLKGDDGTLTLLNRLADNTVDHTAFLRDLPAGGAEGVARMSFDDADEIAKGFALTETRDLLYDISRKHNAFDLARHIFPFGEAWLEIITRWAHIIRENPRVLRRLDQTISSARDSGFFYNDDSTGEEVFAYPGSGIISKWMFGDDQAMRFTGRVSGFNLMLGQFIPGFGPVIQIPAASLARGFLEHPDNKFIRELLLPFGYQDADTPGEIVDSILPTWMRRLAVAFERPTGDDQRVFNNTVIDVLRIMVDTGQADIGTQVGFDEAMAAATRKAKMIYALRAASAFMGPTPASPRFYREDRKGQLWSFTALSDEYHKLVEDNQGSEYLATQAFSQLFGMDPSLYVTPKTRSLVRRSTTESGSAFEARNPALFGLFPRTAYYARPDSLDDPFDYNAYVRQLRERTGSGEATRQALTAEQWAMERNEFLGRMAYHHARVMMGDQRTSPAGKAQLATYREMLMNRYVGFNSAVLGIEQRATRDDLIREFLTWKSSPALMATDAGQGLAAYTAARQQAIDALVGMGLTAGSLGTAQRAAIYRDWLRAVARQVIAQHPSFLTQWTEVWSREIEEADLEAERQQIIEGVSFGA